VLRNELIVLDPDVKVALEKSNQANQPERVDLQRLVRVADWRQGGALFVEIFNELWGEIDGVAGIVHLFFLQKFRGNAPGGEPTSQKWTHLQADPSISAMLA
jgi:hypothetical protein